MNITRHNYEEYFLLYVDNELAPVERTAVETFVEENPDLREELVMLQDAIIQPDEAIVFDNKEALLKKVQPIGMVDEANCEGYFVLYGDNELNNREKDLVEQFVYRNPQYQQEFELLQQVRMTPDKSIVFPDKNILYRHEKGERVIVMRWWRIAAAAAILLFAGGYGWYSITNNTEGINPTGPMADVRPAVKQTPPVQSGSTTSVIHDAATTGTNTNTGVPSSSSDVTTKPVTGSTKTGQPAVTVVTPADAIVKKVSGNGNKETDPIVSQPEPSIPSEPDNQSVATARTLVVTPEDPTTNPAVKTVVVASSMETTPTNNIVYITPDDDEPAKKGALRGLLRKVSRTFEKATSATPGEDSKGGLRIANLEIALK